MRSEQLRHFPSTDPIPTRIPDGKRRESEEISAHVAEFKAKGGVIQVVGSEANRNPQFRPGAMVSRHGGLVTL